MNHYQWNCGLSAARQIGFTHPRLICGSLQPQALAYIRHCIVAMETVIVQASASIITRLLQRCMNLKFAIRHQPTTQRPAPRI